MVNIYGTSHVSRESIELIDEKMEEHDPEIVALELDMLRLESLLNQNRRSSANAFLWLAEKFQRYIGGKTGLMPGHEMKHAFEKAMEQNREVALIDQDIRTTVARLKQVRRKEKVRAGFSIIAGAFMPGAFDPSTIPEEDRIDSLLEEFREEFPELYRALIQDRNRYMAESLRQLENETEGEIVAFVGAGHVKEVKQILNGKDV